MRSAVFLDRDGVIIETAFEDGKPVAPRVAAEAQVVPGARAGLRQLSEAGFALIVVTNQPDVTRGTTSVADVEAIHDRLRSELPIDAVYWCPHDNRDDCECRKPRPGMLTRAAVELGLDLHESWLIGDRWVDVAAALAAGVRPVLLERPYSWDATSAGTPASEIRDCVAAPDLGAAIALILDFRRGAAAAP